MLIDFNYRVFGLFYFNLFDWKCEKINNIGYFLIMIIIRKFKFVILFYNL